jgi:hypothetical protein
MSGDENTAETEVTAELAKPEDVTAYVEDRQEQIAADRPIDDDGSRTGEGGEGPVKIALRGVVASRLGPPRAAFFMSTAR